MGEFFKSCFNGLVRSIVPWFAFGVLIPMVFFGFHPFEPFVFFAGVMFAVALFFINKWGKGMPAAKKATSEAEAAGEHFMDIHPTDENKESPVKRFKNKFFTRLFTTLICASMLSCSYQAIYNKVKDRGRTVAAKPSGESREWEASTITLPYLEDSTLYVSNNDSLLSPTTVDSLNTLLHAMDSELGVTPAFVACHTVKEGNTYRVAVDLINEYGLGNKNTTKGVCVVVAYDQHSCTIAPTTSMEGELTDATCGEMLNRYVQPFMKIEQPDSAMLHLANGMLHYLRSQQQGKGEFVTATPSSKGWLSTQSGVNVICIFLLCMLFGYLDAENKWTKPAKPQKLVEPHNNSEDSKPNHLKKTEPTPPPHKGGSFGGGKSGGGGATTKW